MPESKKWIVYVHTNIVNDKKYVGITSVSMEKRAGLNGQRYKSCTHFNNAIEMYGWENFNHDVVADSLTKEQAVSIECALINIFHLNDSNYGYNITDGGEGTVGMKHTEETKTKLKERMETPEFKQYMIDINSKKTICLETLRVFDSCKDAARFIGRAPANVSANCRGETKSCGYGENGERLHWMYYDDYLKADKLQIAVAKMRCDGSKPVVCLNTGDIFQSMSSAQKWCGVKGKGCIHNAIAKNRHCGKHPETGAKLRWDYIDISNQNEKEELR